MKIQKYKMKINNNLYLNLRLNLNNKMNKLCYRLRPNLWSSLSWIKNKVKIRSLKNLENLKILVKKNLRWLRNNKKFWKNSSKKNYYYNRNNICYNNSINYSNSNRVRYFLWNSYVVKNIYYYYNYYY